MLQNSSKVTHYGPLPPASEAPQAFALDLTGVDISIR
jgi:hypothetical protein